MRLENDLDPHVVTWLLSWAVKPKVLVKLAGRLGLEYPGTRLSTIPPPEIAAALMERWTEPDVRREITTALDRALPDQRGVVAQTDHLEELTRKVLRDPDPSGLHGFIWALAQSPRLEARGLAGGLIQAIARVSLEHAVSDAHALVEDLELDRSGVAADLKAVQQALRRAERERARLADKNAQLQQQFAAIEARLHGMTEERKALEKEVRTLRRRQQEAEEAIRTHAELEAQLLRAREEMAAVAQAAEAMRGRLDAVEAERRGLLADLEEMSRWLHRLPGERVGADLRVGVFIDGENLLYSARAAFGVDARVSLQRVLEVAARGRTVTRVVAYVGRLPVEGNWEPPQPTLTAYRPPYIVRYQHPIKRRETTWTGNQDVGIALDILTQAGGIDVVVLASGDGDFLPLLTYCKRRGIRVEVMAFPGSDSSILALSADAYQDLGPEVLWAGGALQLEPQST